MIRAVDLGFGSVKAISPAREVEYPSAVGTFRPVRFTSDFERQELINKLCIEHESKRYFVGNIAYAQSSPRATMSKERYTSQEGLALMMSALLLLSNNQAEKIKLIAGLPVNEYALLKERYQGALKGSHFVQIIEPGGAAGDFNRFDIEDVKIIPQPMGTLFDIVLDDAGQLKEKELAGGRLACLDIGRFTTDLVLVDGLQFIDKSSTSYNDIGLYESFKDLSLILKNASYDLAPDNLEPYIRGSRTIPGIAQHKEQAFASLAEKIASRLINCWPDMWSFDKVYITGGGAICLGSYIAEALNSEKIVICDNATMTNCRGFFKFGKRVFE